MDIHNLDISMYSFKEVLELFNINSDEPTVQDVKNAKKTVLMTHPDKSKLDSKYFLFFKKAFDVLYNYYQNNSPKGPRIYRYKVTINIDESGPDNTNVRVSASGELEQDGKILESGGIHEPEFFKRFFASMNKSIFLDENLPSN